MEKVRLGVIGGTGLYNMEGLKNVEEVRVSTPFGKPSDAFIIGELEGSRVAFLSRHGRGHVISPTELPVRANIYGFKSLGVEQIVAVNSAGSLKEEIHPGDLLIPDQIIDRTRGRVNTFFGGGLVVHVPFADPFCPALSEKLFRAAKATGVHVHKGGTFVVMEGPQFSTRAESNLYRSWGASLIGMTALPEAKLAREAEICYASIGCVTDYDCWYERHESVTAEMIIKVMTQNISHAQKIIRAIAKKPLSVRRCECATALKTAIVTSPQCIGESLRKKYGLLVGQYIQ